jgi:hypothetical protein
VYRDTVFGLTPDKYVDTQRKIFHYWRDRGFDVTGEEMQIVFAFLLLKQVLG